MDLDECLASGLVRKVPPSLTECREQLKKAGILLGESYAALQAKAPNAALMTAYAAALDAGRALMFRDGFREKSHACVTRFLEARYVKQIGPVLIDLMDEYRDKRHKTQYSASYYPDLEEARRVITFADALIRKINGIMKAKKTL